MSARIEEIDDFEVWWKREVLCWTLQCIADYYDVNTSTIWNRLNPSYNKGYFQTDKGKDVMKRANQSEKGKRRKNKYYQSLKCIENNKVYQQSVKGKLSRNTYRQSDKGKETLGKIISKHRQLGFIPLNNYFEEGDWHHIDEEHVICIPKELHRSIRHNVRTGEGMEAINEISFGYITEETFDKLISGEV